tara:strand:- start:72 stop:218 length:147 start_codon:yes stop_codon:yes gene_type:complete
LHIYIVEDEKFLLIKIFEKETNDKYKVFKILEKLKLEKLRIILNKVSW